VARGEESERREGKEGEEVKGRRRGLYIYPLKLD